MNDHDRKHIIIAEAQSRSTGRSGDWLTGFTDGAIWCDYDHEQRNGIQKELDEKTLALQEYKTLLLIAVRIIQKENINGKYDKFLMEVIK